MVVCILLLHPGTSTKYFYTFPQEGRVALASICVCTHGKNTPYIKSSKIVLHIKHFIFYMDHSGLFDYVLFPDSFC